jgi:hypothetical protein
MRRLVRVTFTLSLLAFAACGPGASGDDDDDVTENPCTGSGSQCVGNQYQECRDDRWVIVETCSNLCNANLGGCIDCNPGVNTCNGNAVVECGADGSFGGTVETCAAGTECQGGSCERACSADGVDLIYVVDDDNNLLSFDPRNVGTPTNPFSMIGRLNCPAGTALDGSGPATPFSMAIDRDATAWVLYSSGRIFNVSTQNAACTATSFTAQQNVGGQQWDLFGMGYVTDTAGGDTEKLWIGGGDADASVGGSLGWLTPGSLAVNRVGPCPPTPRTAPSSPASATPPCGASTPASPTPSSSRSTRPPVEAWVRSSRSRTASAVKSAPGPSRSGAASSTSSSPPSRASSAPSTPPCARSIGQAASA